MSMILRSGKQTQLTWSGFATFLIICLANFASQAQCNFKPIGHRGGSSYNFPENTLVSLEQGFMEGIYAAEVDVRFTSDSVLVLMHDSYIDRTTNRHGEINELPLSYIRSLDAGSWKGAEFAGTQVPTLNEALMLASKFQKKLYLNMKVFVPELIAKTLKESNLPEDIILLDPDDLDKVAAYHAVLPNTPLVYFGAYPEDEGEYDAFFNFLKNHGVVAIEIPADFIYNDQERYKHLQDEANENGIEFWAYTANDAGYFQFLKDFGIDALETDRPSEASRFFCLGAGAGFFPEKQITGQWDFEGDLGGTIGSQLVAMGDTSLADQKIRFGTTKSFGLPNIENTEVKIAQIPAFDPEHALRFFSNIAPEGLPGGLTDDNTYTIILDLLKPKGNGSYTAILQTSNSNADDADFFLLGPENKTGVLEQYSGGFADSTWVRLALVFDLYAEKLTQYLDGDLAGTINLPNSKNGRFSLNNNWGIQSSNLFSDDDGETNPLFVSSIQLRNYAMSEDEIRMLGKCTASKISQSFLSESACPEFSKNITAEKSGDEVSLSVFAGDAVNYRWEVNKGNGWEKVAGENFQFPASPTLLIRNAALTDVDYKFRCIASNDCAVASDEFTLRSLYNATTTIASSGFRVYPNPSAGKVSIDIESNTGRSDLRISSIQGTIIMEKKDVPEHFSIDLPPGAYLIQIRSNGKNQVKKLIVNRQTP